MLHADSTAGAETAARTAAFTLGSSDAHDRSAFVVDDHRQSGVGTLADTHTAAGTQGFNALGIVWLKFDLACVDGDGGSGGSTFGLGDGVRNVFGTLTDTGKVYTGSGGTARVKLRVGFKQPLVGRAGDTKQSPHNFRLSGRLDSSGENDQFNLDFDRHAKKGVFGNDDEVLVREFLNLGDTAADELGAFVLDTVVELFVGFAEGADVHVEDVGFTAGDLFNDLVGVLQRVHAAEPGTVRFADAGVVTGTCTKDETNGHRGFTVGRTD